MLSPEIVIQVIAFFIPFLFSLCFHEFAHAWAAKRLGDNTAVMMGRYTLNPLAHIDWLGTVILPIMALLMPGMLLFGWAKPVPVRESNLRNPRKDMFWVALAGPMSNIFLYIIGVVGWALVSQLQLRGIFAPSELTMSMFKNFLILNLFLAFFNLIPLHPLDGGKILARFIPPQWDMWLESKQPYMNILLLLLVISGGLHILALPVYWIYNQSIGLVGML